MNTVNNLVERMFDWPHSTFPAVSNEPREPVSDDNRIILVSNIISQFGVPAHIKGYAYLREAIIIKIREPDAYIPITKVIYPSIAAKFHVSPICVERAIRHAIEAAWSRTDQADRNRIFSHIFSHSEKRPTNSEFIAMIADRIVLLYN